MLFLTTTVKTYSSRNHTQNNQYKKVLQSGIHSTLIVWWDIYSQVYYLLFKNKTGSKEIQFEKLANDCVVYWSLWKTVCLGLEYLKYPNVIPIVSQITTFYMQTSSYFICFV